MKKILLLLLFFTLFQVSCGNKVKGEKQLVWVKGISYGFHKNPKQAQLDSKKNMGGYLVGVHYTFTNNQVKVTTDVFQSSLSPTADISKIKSGKLENGLFFQQFPISAEVMRPVRLPALIKGRIPVKESGSYYYPMLNKVLKEKFGSFKKERSGMIYIKKLQYKEKDPDLEEAGMGVIYYELYITEE